MPDENSLSVSYIGSGCNKSSQIVDWNSNNVVSFGNANSVAVYDPACGKIITKLVGHLEIVTCVKWIKGTNSRLNELVSGSADSKVIFWSLSVTDGVVQINKVDLSGHTGSILAVDGIYRKNISEVVIVSASADNTARIWSRKSGQESFHCLKNVECGLSFPLSLNVCLVPESETILLAIGTDNPDILLYSIGETEEEICYLSKMVGHEDWIRCIDIAVLGTDILIASSSQDVMVRISKLSRENIDTSTEGFSLKKEEIILSNHKYYLSLETVLFGHEGWVYSVNWSPNMVNDGIHLLTASFDRTLIIWKPCPDTGVWLEESRMGELGGDNTLGYYGAKFSPDGSSVLAHSYQGSFHLWRRKDSKWVADFVLGGHSDAVMDIAWEREGRYLISVSSDKSTRLHAPCSKGIHIDGKPWCELSRPQIHGHALYSVTALPNLSFASCSEEKVVRVFSPSSSVLKLLNYFSDSHFEIEKQNSTLPISASVTALGLSNQATFEDVVTKTPEEVITSEHIDIIPNEDYIIQNTLWPEVMKLYGHGNDVFCATSSQDGKLLATASKATSADQAKIILWNTDSWNIISKLDGHQLTVTQMAFSPDDSYLLSVSRDRKWCLYKKGNDGLYTLSSTAQKGKIMHSRIIWSCDWSHDGNYFVTGSRDCKIIIWDKENPVADMTSEHGSVTAVSFGPTFINNGKYILAVGHDGGMIQIFKWSVGDWSLLCSVPPNIGHHLTVQRLRFRPLIGRTGQGIENGNILQLASCSADHSVHVFDIKVDIG